MYDTPNVDVLWEKFTSTLWEVIDEHVPKIENVSNRKSSYKKAKYPCHINKLLNQKLHLWRLVKRTGYEHHKAKYPCHIKKLLNQKLHLWRLVKRTGYEHHKAKFRDIKKIYGCN